MKYDHNILTVPFEKSKDVPFSFSIMENICVLQSPSSFQVKFICCIAFGSASSFCCLL